MSKKILTMIGEIVESEVAGKLRVGWLREDDEIYGSQDSRGVQR